MRRALPLAMSIALLAGCGNEGTATVGADPREAIEGTWYPLEIEGYTVDPEFAKTYAKAYLEFDDGEWKGSDGCNGMSGTYELDEDGAFDLEQAASTEVGCANVPHYDVMDKATKVAIDGETLTFSGTSQLARYTRTKNPAPTQSQPPSPAASTP